MKLPVAPRVCFITSGLGPGGAERQLVLAAVALKGAGASVSVVSILEGGFFLAKLTDHGIPVSTLKADRTSSPALIVWRIAKEIRVIRPDILIGFNYPGTIFARLAGVLGGVPAVISSLRTERTGGAVRRAALRLTDSLSRVTTTNSRFVADRFISEGLVRPERLRVIPNGVDVDEITPELRSRRLELRAELGTKTGHFLWVAAGRLDQPKDYPNLLAAMRHLRSSQQATLAIIGEGPLRRSLEQQIDETGIRERVKLAGFKSDVPAYLAAADGVVLSSAWEGMPNVIIEAFAVAAPVVSTDVGGIREIVQNGVSGFIASPRDPGALGAAMDRLMHCTERERRQMGHAGRAHIVRTFSSAAAGALWSQLINDCCNAERQCAI
jgi:glycosyltransferase involved in cell wall biosynthesis